MGGPAVRARADGAARPADPGGPGAGGRGAAGLRGRRPRGPLPGHTDGSIAVHLPHHGVLFTGDCVAGVGRVMPGVFNVDRAAVLVSVRRLASLAPSTVCFGHGDPVTEDATRLLLEAAGEAPADRDTVGAAPGHWGVLRK
ncbi:MBL fold metallo-hydrolase [Streptomyces zhihengii]